MENRRLQEFLNRFNCSNCKKLMKYVLEASGDYYCKPCVEKRMWYEPLRFRNVRAHHHMTKMCETFAPFLGQDNESKIPNNIDVLHKAIIKLRTERKMLDKIRRSYKSVTGRPRMTEVQDFMRRLTVYYESTDGIGEALGECVKAGACVTKLVEPLPINRIHNRIKVIAIRRTEDEKDLNKYKRIFQQTLIPTLDIDYFSLILKCNDLTVMDYFLLVPEDVEQLKGLNYPYFTISYD